MTKYIDKDYFRALPNEILENIFSYLINNKRKEKQPSAEDTNLKCATLVCKRWNEVISSSTKFMSRFVLQLTQLSLDDLEYPVFIRRYQACEFFKVPQDCFDQCMSIMRNYGHEIKEITFYGTFPEKRVSLLYFCKNLETLKLYNLLSDKKFESIRNISASDFPKLKNLTVVNRPQNVSSTKENEEKAPAFMLDFSQIINSFSQVNIENIKIYSKNSFYFPHFNEWQITKLDIGKIVNIPDFVRFLNNQKACLKDLSVLYNSSILEYIMLEQTQLTKLKLHIDHVPENAICNNFIEPDTCLQELSIHYTQLSMRVDFIHDIFRHYSKIESLTLNFAYGGWAYTQDDYNDIQLNNLKYLKVSSNSNFVFLRGKFPCLKSLHIDNFRGSTIYSFPSIKTLESLTINQTSYKLSSLTHFYPNLKYLFVGDGIELTENEMRRIVKRLPKLETLVIKKYLWRIDLVPKDFLASIKNSKLRVIFQYD